MRFSSKEKIVKVDGPMAAKVIVLWWLLSLIVVRALVNIPFAAPLLEAVRQAVPVVEKYGQASGYNLEVAGFYCFFLLTSPLVAVYYYRFTTVTGAISGFVKLIFLFLIALVPFAMTIGFDLEPSVSGSYSRMFHTVLTISWLGSSLIFGLYCHVFIAGIVCLAKDRTRRLSTAQ
jgi:hypothetical protein